MRNKQFVLIIVGILVLVLSSIGVLGAYAMSKDETPAGQHQDGEQGYLGITAQDTDDGVEVRTVERRSAAREAGVERGDIITAVDGDAVETVEQLRELIAAKSAGDVITLTVLRDEESIDLEVTLGSRRTQVEIFQGPSIEVLPPRADGPIIFNEPFNANRYQLGVGYRSLTPAIAENEDFPVDEGALITSVVEDSPAADAGLQEGDIIVAVDGDAVDIEHTLPDRLYAYEAEDQVILTVLREGETLEIGVVLASDHPDKLFGQGRSFGGRSIAIQVDPENPNAVPFDIETLPYELELTPFSEDFNPFNGEFIPFDGELHFEGGTFSFPEFDAPQGVVPSQIMTLSCTNERDSSFDMSLTLPLSIDGEVMDELPDNVMEALENAGYACEISTVPFESRSDIEADENL